MTCQGSEGGILYGRGCVEEPPRVGVRSFVETRGGRSESSSLSTATGIGEGDAVILRLAENGGNVTSGALDGRGRTTELRRRGRCDLSLVAAGSLSREARTRGEDV